jgi:soluble P-type ATPase
MEIFNLLRKDGSQIENMYESNKSEYLGIIFSGIGYTLSNPLLYYINNLLYESNIDSFGINFGYNKNIVFKNLSTDGKKDYFSSDNEMIIQRILELNQYYKKIILIGKSLGTGTIRQCLKNYSLKDKSLIILLTPGSEWEQIVEEIKQLKNPILVVGSLMDKLYTVKNLTEIHGKEHIEMYELKEGDHSLEINNILKDIEQLKMIMERIKIFIKKIYE